MITAEFRVVPVGVGSSMKGTMDTVVKALEASGIHYEVGSVATTLEAPTLHKVLEAIEAAHDALIKQTPRVAIQISIDHRVDNQEAIDTLRAGRARPSAMLGPFG